MFLIFKTGIYPLLYILSIAGLVGILIAGKNQVSDRALKDLRIEQLRAVQLDGSNGIQVLEEIDGVVLSEYFDKNEDGYRYVGGLYGCPWQIGQSYKKEELDFSHIEKVKKQPMFAVKLGGNNIYINIDRGGEESVKDFLMLLDGHAEMNIDTLYLDFRFLRSMDFGTIIRLFNQISPPDKIKLGTVLGSYQDQEIKSSGRPFFRAGHYVFITEDKVPLPVISLISSLTQYPEYTLTGGLVEVPDTVCLYTDYRIGPDLYHICTEKWAAYHSASHAQEKVSMIPDSIRTDLMRRMDEYWYKERDSLALGDFLPEMLQALLP